ncbi:MAG: CpsD/CapB family tyrosine-protein kinase [Candidatus Zixiibacteriota bacterium]|nr:MAG: CpsD/CapB family tyrosine-protein kinase [candidate division Zixibacteria bacterium]
MANPRFSVVDFFDLEAPYVTEYRRLLYKMLNTHAGDALKSILVTSAMVGEGKSTISSFLAMTAAAKKALKTLVIDVDLRRPSIHKLFGLSAEPGMVEILSKETETKSALRKSGLENLDILPAGRVSGNPSEIFDADAIAGMIEEMKFYYDLILIDCAPLLPVSDPMLLAPRVDGTLLVVKAGATQKELVERAAAILNPEENKVLGVVLNNMNHILPYYYDYDYYHYDFHKPASKKTGNAPRAGATEPAEKANIAGDDGQELKDRLGQK